MVDTARNDDDRPSGVQGAEDAESDDGWQWGAWRWAPAALILLAALLARQGTPAAARTQRMAQAPDGWQVACIACGHGFERLSTRSAAVDDAGRVHVAYGGRQLYHAVKEEAGPWHVEVVDAGHNTGLGATLALDGDGHPHIFYWDDDNLGLKYAWFDGAAWQRESVPFNPSLTTAPEAQLALDDSGQAHVAFVSGSTLYYGQRTPSGWQWNDVSDNADRWAAIAVDELGQPHIVYGKEHNRLTYSYLDGAAWVSHTFAEPARGDYAPDIAIDDHGQTHIVAYGRDYEEDIDGVIYLYEDASGWQTELITAEDSIAYLTVNGIFNSLRLDSNGAPHVSFGIQLPPRAYSATKWAVGYARRTPSGWGYWQVTERSQGITTRNALVLDENDVPQVLYVEHGELRSATPGETPWPYTVVDRNRDAGAWSALALDKRGAPHVAYTDSGLEGLWYGTVEDGAWTSTRINYDYQYADDRFAFAVGPDGVAHAAWAQPWRFGHKLNYGQGNSGGWSSARIEAVHKVNPNSIDLAVNNTGLPQLSFDGSFFSREERVYGIAFMRQTASGWGDHQYVDLLGAGQTMTALDSEERPHVVYARSEATGEPIYELVDAVGVNGVWAPATIETSPGASFRLEGFVGDRQGRMHLAYVVKEPDAWTNTLRYAQRVGGAWQVESLTTGVGDVSLYVDGAGAVHLTYYRYRQGALHYVTNDGKGWETRLQWPATDIGLNAVSAVSAIAAPNQLSPQITFYDPQQGALKLFYQEPPQSAFLPLTGAP